MRIVILAGLVASGLFALLAFPVHSAEAASMTFSSDTTITSDQTIASDETWTIDGGVTLKIAAGVTIDNRGSISNHGIVNNYGRITNSGDETEPRIITNDGTVNNYDTIISDEGTIDNHGTINNAGILTCACTFTSDGIIENSGTINQNNGDFYNVAPGIINNSGTINHPGDIHNYSIINNSGTINNDGYFWNYGTINNNPGGIINNIFIMDNKGTINNKCGARFNVKGTFVGNPVNYEKCYSLNLFEGTNPSDYVINQGQEVRAAADTNDTSISQVTLSWVDPDGNTDSNTVVALSGGIAENSFTPDQAGEWTVNADFGNGVIIHKTLNVSALVIPESPIGIIALIVSSLGVLGGFMYLRRNSSTSQSYSLGNLER